MTRLLIFSSPVDHHSAAAWYRYRDRITEMLVDAGAARSVAVDDDPLFTYGVDPKSALSRVNSVQPGGSEIVLAQWSAIVFYSASVLFLGDGVDPHAVRSALRSEPFLRDHAGEYTVRSAACYGYELYPFGDADTVRTSRVVQCVPDRVYVGPRWLVNDAEGEIDGSRFEVLRDGGRLVAFRPRVEGMEEEMWQVAARDEGIAVLSASDPRLPAVLASTDTFDELTLFLGDGGGAFPRATVGRCHMDDTLVCLYNHRYLTDENLKFVV